ncbi:hypothetical protein Salat_1091200 [Sesamum alatum]|uniref:Uncharacterized protein n=1 Tax=Sesamum alatum TaxID=300844 RepID=A0AAE1YMT5_9LAMI|nr:hypothetical protein Salat_1091200 [Sesamum alatum]
MTVIISENGQKVGFKALKQRSEMHLISAKSMTKLVSEGSYGFVGQLHSISVVFPTEMSFSSHDHSDKTDLDQLLAFYGDIFLEPQGLPPRRDIEHQIVLKQDAIPKKMHLYRYSYAQKGRLSPLS